MSRESGKPLRTGPGPGPRSGPGPGEGSWPGLWSPLPGVSTLMLNDGVITSRNSLQQSLCKSSHMLHSNRKWQWQDSWRLHTALNQRVVSLCVDRKMATRSRYLLQGVLRGLRAHTVCYQSSTLTSSQGRLLWKPQLRLLSCSHTQYKADSPNTGNYYMFLMLSL